MRGQYRERDRFQADRLADALLTAVKVFLLAGQASGDASEAAASPSAREDWRGSGTLLLADDEAPVRDVTARLLSSLGYQVLQASNGEEALRLFGEHATEVRLALIDLTMPRLSGEATLRQLRLAAPDLPLVLMSGYSEAAVLPRFADLKLAGYLQKPFRLAELAELLQRTLPE
jgi:CheY-like chemotaxis protein